LDTRTMRVQIGALPVGSSIMLDGPLEVWERTLMTTQLDSGAWLPNKTVVEVVELKGEEEELCL